MKIVFDKKFIIQQIVLIPVAIVLGYIFGSLKTLNEVHYFGFDQLPTNTVWFVISYALVLYILLTLILNTKARDYIRKLFKIFDVKTDFDPVHIICGVFVCFALYRLILNVAANYGDYSVHADGAINTFDWRTLKKSLVTVSYPLWHISVNLLNKVLYIPPVYSAALVTAGFYTAEYCIIRKLIITYNKEIAKEKLKYIDILAASFMFLQPIYVPWFNPNQYVGQGTPNIWHNPTIISCYPFALICTFLFLKMFDKYKKGQSVSALEYLQSGLFLFLSVAAKPAFIQIFIPAVAVWFIIMLIKSKGKSFMFALKYVLSCIPAGLYCIMIFVLSFISDDTSQGNGIGFGLFEVNKLYTPNIFISLVLAITFPMVYTIVNFKNINNKSQFYFICLCFVWGFFENSFLYETGNRFGAGNFGWGYLVGITLLFCFAAVDWIKPLFEKKRVMLVPLAVYILNILWGFRYYSEMFQQHINI